MSSRSWPTSLSEPSDAADHIGTATMCRWTSFWRAYRLDLFLERGQLRTVRLQLGLQRLDVGLDLRDLLRIWIWLALQLVEPRRQDRDSLFLLRDLVLDKLDGVSQHITDVSHAQLGHVAS